MIIITCYTYAQYTCLYSENVFLHNTSLIFLRYFWGIFRLASLGEASGMSSQSWKCVTILIFQGMWEQDGAAVNDVSFCFLSYVTFCVQEAYLLYMKNNFFLWICANHYQGCFWWWCQISCILVLHVMDI